MLELMLDRHVIYVLMGMSAFAGVVSKVVVGRTLRKLVAAAESMGKSNHPLMRLVRAKFEHTCMISEKVENVGVFVDKYLYEYRVGGVRLHAWRSRCNHKLSNQRGDRADSYDWRNRRGAGVNRILGTYADG